jgi:hypothetical protein
MDREVTFQEVKNRVKEFCEIKDWDQYHDAKEICTHLILEVFELLEPFRYKSKEQIKEIVSDNDKKANFSLILLGKES